MISFIQFAVRVCLVIGVAAANENSKKIESVDFVRPEDPLQHVDNMHPESTDENDETLENENGTASTEDIDHKSVIEAPDRRCQPCYKRNRRGVCRKIVSCQAQNP